MASSFELVADFREDVGKGASRRLRREGKVPAILYGGGRKSRSITLDHNALLHHLDNESFFSSILTVKVGKEKQSAILRDVQRHPALRRILHIDLMRVLDDEAIRVSVPIHFKNEDVAVGVKQQGGIISHLLNEVEVECLPKDLPEFIELDIESLELGQILHLSDLKLPKDVTLTALGHAEESQDLPVVTINAPRKEEPAEVAEEAGEAEAAEEPDAGGEAPAAGDGE